MAQKHKRKIGVKRGHRFGLPGAGRSTVHRDKRNVPRTTQKVNLRKEIVKDDGHSDANC